LNEALLPAGDDEASKTEAPKPAAVEGAKPDAQEEKGVSFAISNQTIWFQVLFALASIYYCMLLTSWGSPDSLESGTNLFGDSSSKLSFWIQ